MFRIVAGGAVVVFTGVHHVALAVRSLEQAIRFFQEVIGLPVGKRADLPDQGVRAALLPTRDGEIELLEPMDPAGGVARFLDRRGEGYHHLCFETPDISAALARAREASLPLIDSTPRPGLAGLIAFLHPRATHGVLVEMAQPPTPSPHPDTSSSTGVGALGIGTVCVAVEDLSAAAKTYARNFDGRADTPIREGGLGGHACAVQVGRSRVTLVHSTDPGSPVRRFLAQRGEGIFGLCLHVADLEAALRHLAVVGIPTEAQVRGTTTVLARVDPARVYGVNLYLCPSTSRTLPHTVVD